MRRPTVATVSLEALQHNLAAIRGLLAREAGGASPGIIAVVKANAYGHGAARVGLAFEAAGAAMLACADIEEGIPSGRPACRSRCSSSAR
jgi:alanine racemase